MYEYVKLLISIVYNNVLYFYMETFAYDGTYFLYYMLISYIHSPMKTYILIVSYNLFHIFTFLE